MTRYNRLGNDRISQLLDRAAEGGSLEAIGKDVGVAAKTVWNIMNDNPLWAYFRTKEKDDGNHS